MTSETQTCSRCHQPKTWDEFAKNKIAKTGRNTTCKPCLRQYGKAHYRANKAEYQAKHKEYAKEHSEAARARTRKWRKEHPEYAVVHRERVLNAYHRKRAVDPEYAEKVREKSRRWYSNNADVMRERYRNNAAFFRSKSKQWRLNNPEKYTALMMLMRHRRLDVSGSFTAEEWRQLKERYGNRCLCCGRRRPLTVDHVIPVVKGGTGDIGNIQPLCFACNMAKFTKTIDYRITC